MKKLLLAASAVGLALSAAAPASAAIVLTSSPGAAVYAGPQPVTFNFDAGRPAQLTGGAVTASTVAGTRERPLGSTGNFASAGPTDGSPMVLDLSAYGDLTQISFIWGSVDTYNTLEVLAGNVVLASFGGGVLPPANGGTMSPASNPIALLTFTGADRSAVTALRFSSSQNAFEIDNVALVPEPATWAMMIGGFAMVGGAMRVARRRRSTVQAFA